MTWCRRKLAVGLSYVSDGFHWVGHKAWAAAIRLYPAHTWPLHIPKD